MTALLSFCLLLVLDDPALVFPSPVPAVTPQPQDVAPGPIRIRPEEWLLVSGKRQCLLIAIPEGVVGITEQQLQQGETAVYRGRFAGGNGRIETRRISDPWIYSIEAQAPGNVTLVVVPYGFSDPSERQLVQLVVDGSGPQPPPGPGPSPQPTPKPGDGDLRVMLLVDQDAPPAALQAVNSQAVRQWLDANCVQDAGRAEWRLWDRSAIESDGLDEAPAIWRKLWQDVKADLGDGPQAVIVCGTDAAVVPIESQPQLLQALKTAKGQQ
jgi:hypothetical protein